MGKDLKEQLISWETAKLAKDKGFDISMVSNQVIYEDGLISDKCTSWCFNDQEGSMPVCSQSLLQRWLREEHKLHTAVYMLNSKWSGQVYDLNRRCYVTPHNQFDTYEIALEKSLNEALKLI